MRRPWSSAGPGLPRCAVSEGVGTAMLLATVVGSGIMGERLAGGNGAQLAVAGIATALFRWLAPLRP